MCGPDPDSCGREIFKEGGGGGSGQCLRDAYVKRAGGVGGLKSAISCLRNITRLPNRIFKKKKQFGRIFYDFFDRSKIH